MTGQVVNRQIAPQQATSLDRWKNKIVYEDNDNTITNNLTKYIMYTSSQKYA